MSLGNDPSNTPPPIEWTEAVAAADEARHELLFDGDAPSRKGILREMGRRPDGSPLPDGPTGLTAGEAARKILRGEGSA